MTFQNILISVSLPARRDENSRAGQGVGLGVVMVQRDAQMPADMSQRGRAQIPNSTSHPNRANERLPERLNPGCIAAGLQHGTIKRRVMRRDEPHSGELLRSFLPQFAKRGLVLHLCPGNAVQVGEDKLTAGRTDQPSPGVEHGIILHDDNGQGARAVPPVVCCFKIQRCESPGRRRARQRTHTTSRSVGFWRDAHAAMLEPLPRKARFEPRGMLCREEVQAGTMFQAVNHVGNGGLGVGAYPPQHPCRLLMPGHATAPVVQPPVHQQPAGRGDDPLHRSGASEGIRTLDTHVGNVMLYQAELRSLPNRWEQTTGNRVECKSRFG